ncbi:class I SAM-dependent methyltransferase [bacterium]|nr:class I SAM-dependent methyltransferase [bacterium]
MYIIKEIINGIKSLRHPKSASFKLYNNLLHLKKKTTEHPNDDEFLNEIASYAKKKTDINDHLKTIFYESITHRPESIVELGTRGGASTFVYERVAKMCGSTLLSVDIDDCSSVCNWEDWKFVKSDDIKFAAEYPEFCKKNKLKEKIDLLFIDTSHEYEHTKLEIKHWFPFLADNAKVIFHDTNLQKYFYHKDGSIGFGWNNHRGVIRAIEEHFNTTLDEEIDFICIKKGFIIRHESFCNGLTVLQKL